MCAGPDRCCPYRLAAGNRNRGTCVRSYIECVVSSTSLHITHYIQQMCVSLHLSSVLYILCIRRAGNIKKKMRSILCVCVSILYTRTTSISLRPNGRLALFFLDLLGSKSFVSFFFCVFWRNDVQRWAPRFFFRRVDVPSLGQTSVERRAADE